MKKVATFILLLFIFLSYALYSQDANIGYTQCNTLLDTLLDIEKTISTNKNPLLTSSSVQSKSYTSILSHPIILSEDSLLPFNISFNIFQKNATSARSFLLSASSRPNLILAFRTEEVLYKTEFLTKLLNSLYQVPKYCNLTVLFTYGDIRPGIVESVIPPGVLVSGTSSYINTLQDKEVTCLVISIKEGGKEGKEGREGREDKEEKALGIICGGGGKSSPSPLVKIAADSCFNAHLPYEIKGGSITTLHRMNLLQTEPRTATYLASLIPALCFEVNSSLLTSDSFIQALTYFVSTFNKPMANKTLPFSSKKLKQNKEVLQDDFNLRNNVIKLFGKTFWFSERFLVTSFLIASFLSLLFTVEWTFSLTKKKKKVNKSLSSSVPQNKAALLRDVRHLIYLIPASLAVITLSFILGQVIGVFIYHLLKVPSAIVVAIKVVFTFFTTSCYFLLILKLQGALLSNAYSYFISIIGMFNIFLFSSIDISLFYLFAFEYIIIFLSRFSQRSLFITLFFFLSAIPFIPYVIDLLRYIKPVYQEKLLNAPVVFNLLSSFVFLPFALIWLRLLIRINTKWCLLQGRIKDFIKKNLIVLSVGLVVFIAIVTAFIPLLPRSKKKEVSSSFENIKVENKDASEYLSITYFDDADFGEVLRHVKISCTLPPLAYVLYVTGSTSSPILYTTLPYIVSNENNTYYFNSSLYPPSTASYSYVADTKDISTITLRAVLKDSTSSFILCKVAIKVQ